MSKPLHHELESLYRSILNGKLPRNLYWKSVLELVEHLGKIEQHGDEFTFIVENQRAFFKRPHTGVLDTKEVAQLRSVLRAAERAQISEEPPQLQAGRTVIVIDHHAAHIYSLNDGTAPQDETSVKPYDPSGFHHHLIHRKEAHYKGERVPEDDSFYEQIAKDLAPVSVVVVVGHGTGTSSAAVYLMDYLKHHHPDTARKVVATESVDLSALSVPQIEEIAIRHMTTNRKDA